MTRRSTKIVATLGPACDRPGVLDRLVAAGVDVARVNCSHGSSAEHRDRVAALRAAAGRVGRHVGVLLDVQGPKLRLAAFDGTRRLETGSQVLLTWDGRGRAGALGLGFDLATAGVQPGERVLVADGRVTLVAQEVRADGVLARVEVGGLVTGRKGVNLPDTRLAVERLTKKDLADIKLARAVQADWVAASFVEDAADVERVKHACGDTIAVVAKIERPQAVANIEEILAVADAMMVARGDLGTELPFEQVPVVQKQLIAAANRAGVPVITATEMLESMVSSSRPTRAEASDVANAVLDGTDAVMLSAETATGADPVGVVTAMVKILQRAEEHALPLRSGVDPHTLAGDERQFTAAMTAAAARVSRELDLGVIATFTETGRSAQLLAAAHPGALIVAFTPNPPVLTRLSLYRGVHAMLLDRHDSSRDAMAQAARVLVDTGVCGPGDAVCFVAGPANISAGANFIRLARLGDLLGAA